MSSIKSIAVFCGSKPGLNPCYAQTAKKVGAYLAEQRIDLVYGGASSGLMGAVASGCLAEGGKVIGVMPASLEKIESVHPELTQLINVDTIQERKEKMFSLSDGFLALPGGSGTLDEIFEVITLSQIGLHKKPCAFLNDNGFYTLLRQFIDNATLQGFIHADYANMLIVSSDIESVIRQMKRFVHPHLT